MINLSLTHKQKQYAYVGIVGIACLLFIAVLLWSLDDSAPLSTQELPQETQIATAGQHINAQEVWVERMESENKLTQKKLDTLEKLMLSHAKNLEGTTHKTQALEHEVGTLKASQASVAKATTGSVSPSVDPFSAGPSQETKSLEEGLGKGIQKITLALSGEGPHAKKQNSATLENTLPAGTFAKAILLGGVDASTAVAAPSDPRPILLRITDKGNLPRKFQSDLKDCHVLASCYGDLSSERVYMRLEKLTVTERLTGEISETVVAGYVVGEDGKVGIRGVVADRAGPVIRNSLVGGFLSGLSKFFQEKPQLFALPMTPLGGQDAASLKQMLTSGLSSGAASGTSNALEKYADFFIKRAEQLQPVLQVAAGREVDIVFTQGTRFGDTSVRKALSKIRHRSRQKALQTLEAQTSHQAWRPSISSQGDQL